MGGGAGSQKPDFGTRWLALLPSAAHGPRVRMPQEEDLRVLLPGEISGKILEVRKLPEYTHKDTK